MNRRGGSGRVAAAMALLVLTTAAAADAHVTREGAWPDADKPVTLDLDGVPRRDALRKLADAAGWSLVVHAPAGDPVDVHVKEQPASKVMEILLDDGDYAVKRDGTLVSVERSADTSGTAIAPPVAPVPPAPPVVVASPASSLKGLKLFNGGQPSPPSHKHASDRTVMGGDLKVAKGETVHDLTVFGGNVDIAGEATGDVMVMGGTVRIREDGRVRGDATVLGGMLSLEPRAHVDGDVNCVGGELDRDPAAIVDGSVSVQGGAEKGGDDEDHAEHGEHERGGFLRNAAEQVVSGIRVAAVLFVIGTMLIALAGRRLEHLRVEVAARPMRSIALGVVGSFGAILAIVALCVTVVGIPVAIIAAIVGVFAVLGAMCAALEVVGEGLLRHRTENPYVHLAVGCAIFVALSAVPWVGHFVVAAVLLAGIGALVATRGAGYLVKRNGSSTPYRGPSMP